MLYRLSKSRRILKQGIILYKKKGQRLSSSSRVTFENHLEKLDLALVSKHKKDADHEARSIQTFMAKHFPKTFWDHTKELVYAIVFAVCIAFLIRQLWFELYEVPTGSMRPNIEELDRLVVSKTTFGLNLPFRNDLTFFKSEYVQRLSAIVFTVLGMDVPDGDATYFYLFPGKKRFVKRCCGKAGDTLYFYGGQIYGIDKDGHEITEFTDMPFLKKYGLDRIDHIPYITQEGKVTLSSPLSKGVYGEAHLHQMNLPVADLHLESDHQINGVFFNGKEWVKDNVSALTTHHDSPQSYSELWGMRNYATARLLTRDEVEKFYQPKDLEDGILYLELHHTPNLTYPEPEMRRGMSGKIHPTPSSFVALIPLNQQHLDTLQKNLYTARFYVENGGAYRYNEGNRRPQPEQFDAHFPNVPNGCYEFYYGKGVKVLPFGFMSDLPGNHPLYNHSPENIQKLFNLGIDFNILFQPITPDPTFTPQRFAYFRDGDLFVMGARLLKREDPTLVAFVKKELIKQKKSSEKKPYIAFVDQGPPLKEGKLNTDFIKAFGLKIPAGYVLALGDNYAMSADSREFGFVPEMNLRGAPSFTFWPLSERVGAFPQPPYPWWTLPNILVWSVVIVILLAYIFIQRSRNRRRHFKKIDFDK